MDTPITIGILAGCAALALILVLLSLHILRKESAYLRGRSQNGEILLLTFDQIMALYRAAPEKWEMQVDGPVYYPRGKEQDGLLVYLLPKERKRYRAWFDWQLSHGEDAVHSIQDPAGTGKKQPGSAPEVRGSDAADFGQTAAGGSRSRRKKQRGSCFQQALTYRRKSRCHA